MFVKVGEKNNLGYFPEDIYIFDMIFGWTYILTHEDDGKKEYVIELQNSYTSCKKGRKTIVFYAFG